MEDICHDLSPLGTQPSNVQLSTEMQLAASEVLHRLREHAIPPNTLKALRTVLGYWNRWHQAAYQTRLGLLESPPVPVSSDTVLVFIAHHAAMASEEPDGSSHVATGMPAQVRERLGREAVHVCRKVAKRNKSDARIDDDVPAIKTVLQRVSLLGTLHERMGLPKPHADQRIGRALTLLRKATARTVPAALPHSKHALRIEEFQGLLQACGHDIRSGGRKAWIALRDRALLLAGFGSGRRRSEISNMNIEHLQHGTVRLSTGRSCKCIWWHIYTLKGRVSDRGDMPLLSVPLIGAPRQALLTWLDILRDQGFDRGPVWRNMRNGKKIPRGRTILGKRLQPRSVARIVQERALQAAPRLFQDWKRLDASERSTRLNAYVESIGAHSLRSGFVTSGLEAGINPIDLAKMTVHSSLSSFRIYDQRKVERNAAVDMMLQLRLGQ